MSDNKNKIECVGIILDGNRRWAKERDLPTKEGHRQGYIKLKKTVEWCKEFGIKHLVVYSFSTENWNRTKKEVEYLMDLFRFVFKKEISKIRKEKLSVHIVGDVSMFPQDIQKMIHNVHDTNPKKTNNHFWLCASYGGRAEIVYAVNSLIKGGCKNEVSENEFKKRLWTAEMPDPDLIIRTGGEKRLSNFLTWGSVYSELFFLDTYWPAFSKKDFKKVLNEYKKRERRHGR